MKVTVNTEWKEGMAFESRVGDHLVRIDAATDVGGTNSGPTPKPLLMTSLAGCTGMDVVAILKKMRVSFDYFNILTEGTLADEHPKKYLEIKIVYQFKGNNLSKENILKAISLSREKYCGVIATLQQAVSLVFELEINGIREPI